MRVRAAIAAFRLAKAAAVAVVKGKRPFFFGIKRTPVLRRGIESFVPRRQNASSRGSVRIIRHRIARAVHDQKTHGTHFRHKTIDCGRELVHAFRRAAAPVIVPHVADDHRTFLRQHRVVFSRFSALLPCKNICGIRFFHFIPPSTLSKTHSQSPCPAGA